MLRQSVDDENLGSKQRVSERLLPLIHTFPFNALYRYRELHIVLNCVHATRPDNEGRGKMESTNLATRIDCVPGYTGRTDGFFTVAL